MHTNPKYKNYSKKRALQVDINFIEYAWMSATIFKVKEYRRAFHHIHTARHRLLLYEVDKETRSVSCHSQPCSGRLYPCLLAITRQHPDLCQHIKLLQIRYKFWCIHSLLRIRDLTRDSRIQFCKAFTETRKMPVSFSLNMHSGSLAHPSSPLWLRFLTGFKCKTRLLTGSSHVSRRACSN